MVTIRWRPRQGHCPPTFLLINQASGKEIPILTKRWAFSPASRGDFSLLFEVTAHTNRGTQRCCINEIRLQIHPWKRTSSKRLQISQRENFHPRIQNKMDDLGSKLASCTRHSSLWRRALALIQLRILSLS